MSKQSPLDTQVIFSQEARKKLLSGIDILANAVKVTLGGNGRHVIIGSNFNSPHITKDGVTVAKSVQVTGEIENIGASLIKEVAIKTVESSGDGTTTATVLAQAIMKRGIQAIDEGANIVKLKKGIEYAVEELLTALDLQKQEATPERILEISTVSANNDIAVGTLIAEAVNKVGIDGLITVEESTNGKNGLEVVNGTEFKRGIYNSYFISNPEKFTTELNNPYILIYDGDISSLKDIISLIEDVKSEDRELLIICNELKGEALQFLIMNNIEKKIKVAVIQCPEYGEPREFALEDIATLTSGIYISEKKGTKLNQVRIEHLGTSGKVIITRNKTTFVNPQINETNMSIRLGQIKNDLDSGEINNEYLLNELKTRYARLTNSVCIIKVAGVTQTELNEKVDRIDDALHAAKAAIESGFVAGGGVALIYAMKSLNLKGNNADAEWGIKIVAKAIEEPFIQILKNAGISDYENILNEILNLSGSSNSMGYDVLNNKIVNMLDAGLIDPLKVVKNSLKNAASIAGILLTTECVVSEYSLKE